MTGSANVEEIFYAGGDDPKAFRIELQYSDSDGVGGAAVAHGTVGSR